MALSAVLVPRFAYPAVPPASTGSSVQTSDAASAAGPVRAPATPPAAQSAGQEQADSITWAIPPIRLGGSLSYEIRQDSEEGRKMVQRGLIATINAATETFIWQPWFAQIGGNMRLTSSRNNNSSTDADFGRNGSELKGLIVTGSGQLRILPQSSTPFEAHLERSDSRTTSQLISVGEYAGQRVGFTQQYNYGQGNASLGFDRTTQDSGVSGRDRQDSLQLHMSHSLEEHRVSVNGSRSHNVHERTGEDATQDNLTIQHNYTPLSELSVDTMANVSRSGYRLLLGGNDTLMTQVSSLAFWRPMELPLTVMGGVRLLNMEADSTGGLQLGTSNTTLQNSNVNIGATYDLTQFVHLNASANANAIDTNGRRIVTANESAGVTYQPETIALGEFRYNWSTSGMASNSTGGQESTRQLTLQLSHSLNRQFKLDKQSTLTLELNQALSGVAGLASVNGDPVATRQATHGGAVSWHLNTGNGSAMMRLSASDSRSLDGNKDYFQLINFQASSNLPTGTYTSWSGNLTIQAVRQGGNAVFVQSTPGTGLPATLLRPQVDEGVKVTSSGSLTYQNHRIFGVRNLRFVSDLRLNGQALLPLFGGPQDQEVAAWDNRFEYYIGRTLLRVSTMIARTKSPLIINPLLIDPRNDGPVRVNKSIMFTMTREFGAR